MIPGSHAATTYAPIRGRVATSTAAAISTIPTKSIERVTGDWKQSLDRWSEVVIPVRKEVGEPIESG